jgi:nitrogen fixation protein FixH
MRGAGVVVALLTLVAACSRGAATGPPPAPIQPVTLAIEAAPAPPTTGENHITVVATGADGTAADDLTVAGELFMPVMESMGKTTIAFTPAGGGRYTGQGNLTMAGAWQLTVTAKRGGQTLATRTFNLTTRG